MKRLPKKFYERDAIAVANDLIGCVFSRGGPDGLTSVRLVEVEAYRGTVDPGSHGYRGETPRTRVMYGPPGHLYVYFTYGMHWCANIVCAPPGVCEAVLLRAGEPIDGIELMRLRRRGITNDRLLASGPARLAQAMGIGPEENGSTLGRDGDLWCGTDGVTDDYRGRISQTVRIGLGANRGDNIPWRFVIAGHPHASRRR